MDACARSGNLQSGWLESENAEIASDKTLFQIRRGDPSSVREGVSSTRREARTGHSDRSETGYYFNYRLD